MAAAFCLLVPVSFLVWSFANVSKLPGTTEVTMTLPCSLKEVRVRRLVACVLVACLHGSSSFLLSMDRQTDGYSLWIWTWLGGRGWGFLELGDLEGPL